MRPTFTNDIIAANRASDDVSARLSTKKRSAEGEGDEDRLQRARAAQDGEVADNVMEALEIMEESAVHIEVSG